MENYITPIKKQLDTKMHEVCNTFMLIGTRRETPRYYNLDDYERKPFTSTENRILITISSTQNSRLYFEVLAPLNYPDYIDFGEFWKQFKEYRTEFLFKNYPSIEQYGIDLKKYY